MVLLSAQQARELSCSGEIKKQEALKEITFHRIKQAADSGEREVSCYIGDNENIVTLLKNLGYNVHQPDPDAPSWRKISW